VSADLAGGGWRAAGGRGANIAVREVAKFRARGAAETHLRPETWFAK
jgi:hypothetical protein